MSYWNAKYTNEDGEYEITFASKNFYKAKAVEKVCCAVIDDKVDTPDDVEVVVHGRWEWDTEDIYICSNCCRKSHVKEVMGQPDWDFCPVCGAKMDGERKDSFVCSMHGSVAGKPAHQPDDSVLLEWC